MPSGRKFNASHRAIAAGAVVLGDAGDAGADENSLRRSGFLLGALLPDRMLLELVEDFRGADRDGVGIAGHGPAVRLQRVAPPELDRIERQSRGHFVDQHFDGGHRLQRAVAAHRSRRDAAGMQRYRGHVDLWDVVNADRACCANGGNASREVRKASAIEHMVRGKELDLAGFPVDPDARVHPEGVAFDAALELLIAVMREPDRPAGKEHRRQRHVKHERCVVAPAKAAADIGELGVDARRLERSFGLAEHMRNGFRRLLRETARQARVRGFGFCCCTRRGRIPAPETSGRRIGFRTGDPAPAGPDFSPRARRGSARHRSQPWHRRLRVLAGRRPHRKRRFLGASRADPTRLDRRIDVGGIRRCAGHARKAIGAVVRNIDGTGLLAEFDERSIAQGKPRPIEGFERLEDQQRHRLPHIDRGLADRTEQVAGVEFRNARSDPVEIGRGHHRRRL